MPDTYDDIIAAATGESVPTRTKRGALKYQPPDADWSLDRLSELQDFYQSTYKRPLPVTVKGQGSIHRKWGLDHRSSADISLNPTTSEGQSLIAELQRRKIPFLAFDRAIPGASTGPHIHVGRPSSRSSSAGQYSVGSQVKKQPRSSPTDYTDIIAAATGEQAPAKPAAPATLPPIEEALGKLQRSTDQITGTVQRAVSLQGIGQLREAEDTRQASTGELRRADEAMVREMRPSSVGQLRRLDEQVMEGHRRVTAEVRRERAVKRGLGMPVSYNPITAVQEYLAGEERVVQDETNRRMQAGYEETERLREISSQFTAEDRRQLTLAVERMHGMGEVSRGLETGSQRFGSGLLYKLAGVADLATGLDEPGKPSVIGDYLRRQAGRGEISVAEIEADLPPSTRQQLADFLAHTAGSLTEIAGATAVGGPIGGFAALGGLEAGGRRQPFSEVARETAKGAIIGGVFAGAGAVESGVANRTFAQRAADTARSSAAIGLGTAATEKVFGATDEEALRAAATNVMFHVGMRVPGEIGRLAQAAEAAYKTPPTEGGTPTVGPELQERLSRVETPTQAPEQITTVPPAKPDTRPPSTAIPAAEAVIPSATAVPAERRSPARIKDADWLELTPEERARVRQEVDLEQQAGVDPAEPPHPSVADRADPLEQSRIDEVRSLIRASKSEEELKAVSDTLMPEYDKAFTGSPKWEQLSGLIEEVRVRQLDLLTERSNLARDRVLGRIRQQGSEKAAEEAKRLNRNLARRPLSEVMAERAEAGPTELSPKAREAARDFHDWANETEAGIRSRLELPAERDPGSAQENQLMNKLEDFAKATDMPFKTEADVGTVNRRLLDTKSEEYAKAGPAKQSAKESSAGLSVPQQELVTNWRKVREELQPASQALQEAKLQRNKAAFMPVTGPAGPARNRMIEEQRQRMAALTAEITRLEPIVEKLQPVYADLTRQLRKEGINPAGVEATNLLTGKSAKPKSGEGGYIDLGEVITAVKELRAKFPERTERELRALLPPTHRELLDREQPLPAAAIQPRTPTGQFSPGAPGGPEADRSLLRTEARKYGESYKRLDLHQVRRNGLDIVNDDVARNYFAQLHRMASEFLPAQASAVDRAETLYNQGKYGQATMLAESVFRSLPDKVNEYAGADAAMQLVERGMTPRANWSKVLQEVRERLKRTGGLSGGGSTFYDVNKHPEGGRPDHAKIAYILEPVIDALKADASRLLAEGKLKAADYVAHVRSEVNKMLQGPEFSDWHPLNKSAALGVLVDKLRRDGPPPTGKPPTTEAQPPQQRQRSLPKTLQKSGRDPGTNTTFDRLPNAQVNERVEARLASEGADALETWYRNAPESADRTAAHRVLVDHYTAQAVKLSDTAPQQAEVLYQRARDLSNLEDSRSTTMGQAVQMYSNLLKYSPAGVMSEIARMERAGVKVPVEATTRLAKTAQEHQRLDAEVHRLERQVVEAEAAESGGLPREGATKPRQYRPRSDTVADSRAERVRRKLDEAAQRRRAQKAAIAAQLRALESQRTIPGYLKRINNITRGLMVSAFATAMRNLQTQALRFDVERLTDTVEHTLRRSVGLDSDLSYRNIWRNAVRQFRPGQTTEAKELLTGHPGEYQRLFNTYAGGVEVPIRGNVRNNVERVFQTVERGVEIANIFNRIQEHHVRSAEFLAELDLHLRKEKNLSLEKFVERHGIDAIPLDTIRKGVDKALEVTFSDMPLRDGAGGRFLTSMIEVGNYIPPTLSPVAFPRFMFNNLKFLYQHSPAGMLDLARKNQNKPRVIARSLVGTSMLLLAYQFRNSDHAGEKWYELKLGDTTLDARPFGPFSTYLFMAEGIRRQLAGEKAFTVEEIAGAIGASTGPSGTAIAVAEKLYDYAANGKWDKWQRVLKTEAGEWGRALLTPVRQVKDLIAAFDSSQAVMRDTSAEPFLGELKESIPYADTNLPPAHRPTTSTPIHQERPATKALSGWRVITPKSFLERQLDELNFKSSEILSSTGDREADAILKRVMGPLADELSRELESDAGFKAMSKAARGQYLREELSRIRSEARSLAEEENPELFDKLKEDRKPERQRKYEEELNSPGLSKAIDLGVPMPIPPRRADEDDIAYRARLLQVGRQRRARLDGAVNPALSLGQQRATLHSALYS